MRNPEDAKKASAGLFNVLTSIHRVLQAAWVLQGFATTFYAVFSVVVYSYVGSTVASPALFSLSPVWSKITFAIGMVNFLMYVSDRCHKDVSLTQVSRDFRTRTGALYAHASAKLIFVRLFRHTHHVYSHTWLGWGTWVFLCFVSTAVAFVFATAVPIFSYLTGITASLFASWYTYGIAGFFWLHDTFHLEGGREALAQRWVGTTIAVLTILVGAFMCVAGTYVSIKVRLLSRLSRTPVANVVLTDSRASCNHSSLWTRTTRVSLASPSLVESGYNSCWAHSIESNLNVNMNMLFL